MAGSKSALWQGASLLAVVALLTGCAVQAAPSHDGAASGSIPRSPPGADEDERIGEAESALDSVEDLEEPADPSDPADPGSENQDPEPQPWQPSNVGDGQHEPDPEPQPWHPNCLRYLPGFPTDPNRP